MRSKRPRKIVVNGVEFHWKTKLALYFGPVMRIVILHIWQIRAGSTLSVWLAGSPPAYIDTAYPKPNDVREIIECAIAKGWNYGERGPDFTLSSADKLDLDHLRVL